MAMERGSGFREKINSRFGLKRTRREVPQQPSHSDQRLQALEPISAEQLYRGRLVPIEGLRTADRRAEDPQLTEQSKESKLQYVSQVAKTSQAQDEKPRGLRKFYLDLKERREHPQKGLGLAFDIGLETLGVPLVAIPGMQWLALLTPVIPWIVTYTTGDALNLAEAAFGKTIGGKKLTMFERALYVAGAIAPVAPGRLFVGVWEKLEDSLVYPLLKQRYDGSQRKN